MKPLHKLWKINMKDLSQFFMFTFQEQGLIVIGVNVKLFHTNYIVCYKFYGDENKL